MAKYLITTFEFLPIGEFFSFAGTCIRFQKTGQSDYRDLLSDSLYLIYDYSTLVKILL